MFPTYPAVVRAGQLEWEAGGPPDDAVRVHGGAAVSLRQSRKMSLGDALVAATALVFGRELLTRNVKDFAGVPGLVVVDPLAAGDPA